MEHPTGIEPWGNYYMRGRGTNIRGTGLGDLSVLGDALILELLGCGILRAVDLGRLALTSKALYCFANLEELWRSMVIEELGGKFSWCGTWQRTYLVSTGLLGAIEATIGRGDEGSGSGLENGVLSEDDSQDDDDDHHHHQGASGSVDSGNVDSKEHDEEMQADVVVAAAGPRVADEPEGDGARSGKRRKVDSGPDDAPPAPAIAATAARALNKMQTCTNGTAAAPTSMAAAVATAAVTVASDAKVGGCPPLAQGGCSGRRLLHRVPGCGSQRYLRVRGFYSDLLYQPWFCATLKLPFDWLEEDNIDRRSGLTPEQFRREYEIPNRPVILTDVISSWPAMTKWNRDYLAEMFGDREVIVGNMPMPFTTYLSYCSSNRDEMPLYLFDKHFAAVAPSLESDYSVPPQFGEDLFGLLGEEGRPDYRWLILGPGRSGSSFHVDPNATSAWNALLWGAKKWVMYPPGAVPPGVHPSPDGADVATPLSLTEWFVNFYAATREGKVRPVEFVARPGELLFVPRGWWHCALNLEESCALTQNFVSEVGLPATLAFLRSRRPELVSGCTHENRSNLYDRFVEVLKEKRPEVLAAVEARRQEARAKAREANRLAALFRPAEVSHGNGGSCTNSGEGNGMFQLVSDCPGDVAGKPSASGGGAFSFGFSFGGDGGTAEASSLGAGNSAGGASNGGFKFGFGVP